MPPATHDPDSYYVATGPGTYRSTVHTQGVWSPDHQHMGPVSGLLVHELETCQPRDDLNLSRVSFDILGVIPQGDVEVSTRVTRPGRTVELVEAELVAGGRPAVRARAWRLVSADTTHLVGSELPTMPARALSQRWDGLTTWGGAYIASVESRVLPGWRPGRGQVWIRPRVALLDGVDSGDLATVFCVVDTMNGVAVREKPGEVLFPNIDLTVHLMRRPLGAWLGMDVEVSFGPSGVGMTSAVLNDEEGPFGRAVQILTVRQG